jgi:hypothetical protein
VAGHDRGDQLAPQGVLGEQVAEALDDPRREVALELPLQVWVVGQVGGLEALGQAALGVGQQHGDLGAQHPLAGAPPPQELLR